MWLRRCSACGRRLLRTKNYFQNPFKIRVQCDYCGTEYRLRKSIFHILALAILWFMAFLVFVILGMLESGIFLKVLSTVILFVFVSFISSHIGSLEKIGSVRRSKFWLFRAKASKDVRFRSSESEDEKAAA